MSDRDRISAVLRLHQWRAVVRTADDDATVLACTCGIGFGPHHTFDCYREHVADAVIAELGRSCKKPTPVRGLSVRKAAAEAAVAASRQLGVPVDQRLVDLSQEPHEIEKED